MPETQVSQVSRLAAFIRQVRRDREITQYELADRLSKNGYFCSESAISHWEKGRADPPAEDPLFLHALSLALDVAPSEVMRNAGFLDVLTPGSSAQVVAKLSPDVLQMIKEAGPQDIKKLEAVIRAVLTEIE